MLLITNINWPITTTIANYIFFYNDRDRDVLNSILCKYWYIFHQRFIKFNWLQHVLFISLCIIIWQTIKVFTRPTYHIYQTWWFVPSIYNSIRNESLNIYIHVLIYPIYTILYDLWISAIDILFGTHNMFSWPIWSQHTNTHYYITHIKLKK